MGNLIIKALILVLAISTISLWIIRIRRQNRLAALVRRIRASHSAEWQALSSSHRTLLPLGGVLRLIREGLLTDPDLLAELQQCQPFRPVEAVLFAIAFGSIAIIAAGHVWMDWSL